VATLRAHLGFRTSNLLTVVLDLPAWRYPDADSSPRFFSELLERVTTMPGVSNASAISALPVLQPAGPAMMVSVDGAGSLSDGARPSAQILTVAPGAFATLNVPVAVGREFTKQDVKSAPLVAVVNRAFAARYVNSTELIVGRKEVAVRGEQRPRDIVGVVGNVRDQDLNVYGAQVYLPLAQDPQRTLTMVVRTTADISASSLMDVIGSVDRDVAPYQLRTFEEGFSRRQASSLILFGQFGTLAFASALLAAGGLYCVYSASWHSAHANSRFGSHWVRARRRSGDWSCRTDGGRPCQACCSGLPAEPSSRGSRLARSTGSMPILFDPLVYIGCAALLLASSAAALWSPAKKARQVAISTLLRS